MDNCNNCVYYKNEECRRYPPKINFFVEIAGFHKTEYPIVDSNFPCGEFKEKED